MSKEIELVIECSECGRDMVTELTFNRGGYITMTVKPCEFCLEQAKKDEEE